MPANIFCVDAEVMGTHRWGNWRRSEPEPIRRTRMNLSRRSPAAAATTVSLVVVGTVLGCQWLLPGGWGDRSWVPLVAGLVVGLPHGAADHVVPSWVLARRQGL